MADAEFGWERGGEVDWVGRREREGGGVQDGGGGDLDWYGEGVGFWAGG